MEAARDGHTLLVKELLEKGAEEVRELEGTGVAGTCWDRVRLRAAIRRGQVLCRVLDARSCAWAWDPNTSNAGPRQT